MGGGSDSKYIVKEHEYCIVYAKNINSLPEMFVAHEENYLKRYAERDDKGRYFWDTFARPGLKNPILYDIVTPDGTIINNGWIHSKERFERELKNGDVRIYKKADGAWSVQFKQRLNIDGKKPRSMTMRFGGTYEGKQELRNLFLNDRYFSYPKSTVFLETLIKTIQGNNDIILDFFSGSATTAHAVMKLNAEDGGKRKFIMVQLPEICDKDEEAYKAGYKNICEIGKERIRRAAKKIKDDNPNAIFDGGFRVLKLDSSNMKNVSYTPSEYVNIDFDKLIDNIEPYRTPEDLLIQAMLDFGILLSSDIEETEIAGKRVFSVEGGHLIACFDENITEETVKAIAEKQPAFAVFRDSSMATDSVMSNFNQIFETYSPKTERKVL